MSGANLNHWIDTSHARIAWRTDGPISGRPLILLQRFRGTMDDWDPDFIEAISRTRRVIRFDSAGIGSSDGSVPDSISGMAEVAAQVIESLGLEDVDLLGWSLGGAVALQLACDYPKIARRLIIAGSSPGSITDGPQPDPRVPAVMTKGSNNEEDFLFLFYPQTAAAQAAGRESLRRIRAQSNPGVGVSPSAFMAQLQAISKWRGVLDLVPQLGLPMLVANGSHDIMIPAYRSYVLSQAASKAKLVLYPNSGHAFLFQFINEFVNEVESFLDT